MVIPAADMRAPGASIERVAELCEKQVTLSAAVVPSLQALKLRLPTFASYTAPTLTAPGTHAGHEMAAELPELPEATTGTIPAANASANPGSGEQLPA